MPEETPTCDGRLDDPTGWGRRPRCGNKAKAERDGKWYCGKHDPKPESVKTMYAAKITSDDMVQISAVEIVKVTAKTITLKNHHPISYKTRISIDDKGYDSNLHETPLDAVSYITEVANKRVESALENLTKRQDVAVRCAKKLEELEAEQEQNES